MAGNAVVRQRIQEIQSQTESEKAWWNKRKATIQSDFMKELDEESGAARQTEESEKLSTPAAAKSSDDEAVLVEKDEPVTPSKSAKKKGKK